MPVISRVEMEEILLALQLRSNCVVHFCETSEDLAQMIAMTTKAVAEAPYKYVTVDSFNLKFMDQM